MIRMSKNKYPISNRGTSLIEILVVMLVLLIGIMTVIRVFPMGFGVVKSAESQTIATRLAQREVERWKNMAENLPDGIVPIDEAGVVINTMYPGPPFDGWKDNGSGGYERGNLLNLRQVVGETTSIPVGSFFTAGGHTLYGSRYTLAFGPIDAKVTNEQGAILINGLTIKGGDLRRRRGNADNDPPYLRRGEYAIDYGDGAPSFLVAFPRENREMLYYLTYSYWEESTGTPILRTVLDDAVLIPPDYNGGWITVDLTQLPGFDASTFVEIESNTDSCARGFRAVQAICGNSQDPYEYVLADSICGVIAFNPVGHEAYEYTAQGIRPLVARINYRIYDLRIIREDKVLNNPQNNKISVKMSLSHILDAGSPTNFEDGVATDNPNEETYEGLIQGPGGVPVVPLSMLAIDLATGFRVDETMLDIDFDKGIVTIPENANLINFGGNVVSSNVPMAGRHVRFFYRADGDWTVSCQKAYTRYTREYDTPTVDYRHFKLAAPQAGALGNRLLFAVCESGKTVSVDYTYVDSGGMERKIVGESHRISDESVEDTVSGNTNRFSYVDLTPPRSATLIKDVVVVGTSFKTRVAWRDGRNWRHVDIETTLMRERNKL